MSPTSSHKKKVDKLSFLESGNETSQRRIPSNKGSMIKNNLYSQIDDMKESNLQVEGPLEDADINLDLSEREGSYDL